MGFETSLLFPGGYMDYENYTMSAAETIFALRERLKELTCLYNISDISNCHELSFEEFIAEVLKIIPRSMQYPSATGCRIVIDNLKYETDNLEPSSETISVPIVVNSKQRGFVQVCYLESANVQFLQEEVKLLKGIAQQLSVVIERREVDENDIQMREHLRYADRLATIGQLTAVIAHEIEDPITSILDTTNKLYSNMHCTEDTKQDMHHIISLAKHAKEILRKLLLFSEQVPPRESQTNINKLIKEGFYLLENGCKKQNIDVIYNLQEDVPIIVADSTQIHQAIVNLIVNAMQAMPKGGTLTISTSFKENSIIIEVTDTGCGMDEDTQNKIFMPFFTTKDKQLGTGLGLPVVHGIISAHRGTISVQSTLNIGTSFRIMLPIN